MIKGQISIPRQRAEVFPRLLSSRSGVSVLQGRAEGVLQQHLILVGWLCGPVEGWGWGSWCLRAMSPALLDGRQSSGTALLRPFLTCCWSLTTLAALPSSCASIFMCMRAYFYTAPSGAQSAAQSPLAKEMRCSPNSLLPLPVSPCQVGPSCKKSSAPSQQCLSLFLSFPRKKPNWKRSD